MVKGSENQPLTNAKDPSLASAYLAKSRIEANPAVDSGLATLQTARKPPRMITRSAAISLLLSLYAFASLRGESTIDFQPGDSIANVLTRQVGQIVELRLKSGEKMGGKVEKVGAHLVHLSQITGAEFFEAAVAVEDVTAVVVRAKK